MVQIDENLDILTAYEDEFFILTTTDGEIVYPSMFHAKIFLDNLARLRNGEFFNKTTNEYFIRDVRPHFYNGQLHYLYRYKNITEKKIF